MVRDTAPTFFFQIGIFSIAFSYGCIVKTYNQIVISSIERITSRFIALDSSAFVGSSNMNINITQVLILSFCDQSLHLELCTTLRTDFHVHETGNLLYSIGMEKVWGV